MVAVVVPVKSKTEHDHIYEDKWYPLDRKTVRRVCVLPNCHNVQVKDVSKVPQ